MHLSYLTTLQPAVLFSISKIGKGWRHYVTDSFLLKSDRFLFGLTVRKVLYEFRGIESDKRRWILTALGLYWVCSPVIHRKINIIGLVTVSLIGGGFLSNRVFYYQHLRLCKFIYCLYGVRLHAILLNPMRLDAHKGVGHKKRRVFNIFPKYPCMYVVSSTWASNQKYFFQCSIRLNTRIIKRSKKTHMTKHL